MSDGDSNQGHDSKGRPPARTGVSASSSESNLSTTAATADESVGSNRRLHERYRVEEWSVDCVAEATFLYAAITNISQLGIFVSSRSPFDIGTMLSLRFRPPRGGDFVLPGRVQWVNRDKALAPCRNPGMGIQFVDLTSEDRERLVEVIHTIAYVRDYTN